MPEEIKTHHAADVFDQTGFIDDVEDAIEHIVSDPTEFESPESGGYEYYIVDVSTGAAGTYQPSEICSTFSVSPYEVLTDEEVDAFHKSGVSPEEAIRNAEFVWDFIDNDLIPPIEDELNAWLEEAGLPGSVYFGHLDSDSSFGVFFHLDDAELEDFLDEAEAGVDERGLTAQDRRQNQRFMRDQPGLPYDEE